jgi:hypothetical protein
MAIVLSSNELETTNEVLSSAAQAAQLTRLERHSYRAFMLSVDVATASFVAATIVGLWNFMPLLGVFGLLLLASVLVGTVSLALNLPLVLKASRARARLKELGLDSLSESLWKERRRSRWITRARGVAFMVFGMIFLLLAGLILVGGYAKHEIRDSIIFVLFFADFAVLAFGARYLRPLRERMDLIANAEELRKSLQSLRQRADKAGVVSVPFELLEQTAKIESAQIAEQRKDAVLQSVTSRPTGYAITFDRDATEQRATLGVADRVELGDLVAQLSTDGAQRESRAGAAAGAKGAALRATTKNEHVEIEYLLDQASRDIRIIAVRHKGDGSHTSLNGASDA